MNSAISDDLFVLTDILFASSNLASYSEEQIEKIIIHSNLPKTFLQINKIKKNSKVYFLFIYIGRAHV